MSRVVDFDVLVTEREEGKDRIATVIETALHNVKYADTSEGYAGQALRLRGAAVLLQTAAVEVAGTVKCPGCSPVGTRCRFS